ncbi:hypothetical protein FDP41_013139 [Naegleria fowleri]|uniref:Uncharacterized protein n=1 Tax=Naegleria fowleri TaxID=5763 RepID=A0A6A5BZ30_NAEFO|nr:uncharacterized protein FDP41_013139 [Naegleria fowleri]KAF0980656.1 hypothetical protein FDP41_013139 [Naegleria fowleri]CAG4712352.1 unnamed protein product [Naegleria fowleri]
MSRTACCAPRFLARAIQQINSQGGNVGKCASTACSDVMGSVTKSDFKLMQKFAASDLYKSMNEKEECTTKQSSSTNNENHP